MHDVLTAVEQTFRTAVTEREGQLSKLVNEESSYGFRGVREAFEPDEQITLSTRGQNSRTRRDELRKLTQGQVDFAAKLQSQGLYPMGVVVRPLFNNVCHLAGLVRLESMTTDGQCGVRTVARWLFAVSRLGSNNNAIAIVMALFIVIGALLSVFGLVLAVEPVPDPEFPFYWLHAWWPIILLSLVAVFTLSFTPKLLTRIFYYCSPRWLLVKSLWPRDADSRSDAKIRLQFKPPAPAEFLAAIHACRRAGYQTMFAVQPMAIQLSRRELASSVTATIKQYEKDELRRRPKDECPILYITDGNFVAVMKQYGEFPKEKRVIQWVTTHGAKFCFN